ncbi:MAG: cupin domain-containing protein [Planctomycetaceae bacterium]|nr:cupin domain-containing protein [Planctomycetaceae bacterium]
MAVVTVPSTGQRFEQPAEISAFLAPFGIWHERWDVSKLAGADATSDEILAAYQPEIEQLKQRGGFVVADVINVSPETPNIDALMAKYAIEHTHSEDEVRYTIKGRGVFHINPGNAPVFEILVEAGDLINVPCGTRHWFNLCTDKSIRCIRLFQDPSGWTPNYVEDPQNAGYTPVCWGPTHVAGDRTMTQRAVQI